MTIVHELANTAADCWHESLFEPGYIQELTDQQLLRVDAAGEYDGAPKEFAVVIIDGNNPASALGREVEKTVFWEFFKNDLQRLKEEYAGYDRNSVFIVALDVANRQPAGVIRMIPPSEGGSNKTVDDIANPRYPWAMPYNELSARAVGGSLDLSKTIDVATLALKPEYRQKNADNLDKLSSYMYYAMYQYTCAQGEDWNWIGIIDTKALPGINALGRPLDFFREVPAMPYIDSPSSIPFHASTRRIAERIEPIGLGGFFIRGEGHEPEIAVNLEEI